MILRLIRIRQLVQVSRSFTSKSVPVCTAYKSSISLDKLYPQSSLDITKPQPIPQNEPTKFGGYIPMEKLKFTYSHSSGPGGQNVNSVMTKVDLRFKVEEATWLPDEIRNNLINKYRRLISKEGYFIIQSDRTRYRHMNVADALEKLREIIRSCEPHEPEPLSEDNVEKLRKQKEKAVRERLREKKERSLVKQGRKAVSEADLE